MRKLPVLGLLVVLGLLIVACQAPVTPVDTELSNVQATIEQSPTAAPTATAAPAEPTAATVEADQGDTSTGSDPADSDPAAVEPDPLSVDPSRPGFTLDGSATLGAADAPVVIIDFSDFQ